MDAFHEQVRAALLDAEKLTHPSLSEPLRLETTTSGFEVIARMRLPDGRTQPWHIRQDSRVWAE